MYFNLGKGFTLSFTALLFTLSYKPTIAMANVDEKKPEIKAISFTAHPAQCVTLRQGRNCFHDIKLQWQAPLQQEVCLVQAGQQKKLKCWKNRGYGDMVIEFESNESITYQLRRLSDNKIIAQTQIKVSWQHKSSARKRRWRLF